MKKIPLNCLIILINISDQDVSHLFPAGEILSISAVAQSLVGNVDRPDLRTKFQFELERTALLRLSLGQRVVVHVPDMKRDQRINFTKAAQNQGHHVFYMVDDKNNRRDLLSGDYLAEVLDLKDQNTVIQLPGDDFFPTLKGRGWDGVTVIADVHGSLNSLLNAVSWAKSRNHFMLFLGDIVDYGINTLEVADEVYKMVTRGEAEIIIGNHERKISRYLDTPDKRQFKSKLSEGNKVTIRRIENMNRFDQDRWVGRFRALVNMMRNHRSSDKFGFAHAAVTSDMFFNADYRLKGKMEDLSMFGEAFLDKNFQNNTTGNHSTVKKTYNWVDDIPEGYTAIVGHDIRSNFEPLTQWGKLGGRAIFLDTGCGKGGHLSTVDIRFTHGESKIENFNIH